MTKNHTQSAVFYRTFGHDMIGALGRARTVADLLTTDDGLMDADERTALLGILRRGLESAERLTRQFVRLHRISLEEAPQGTLRLDLVLPLLVEGAAEGRPVALPALPPLTVALDEESFSQALTELLANAFGADTASPTLTVHTDAGHVVLRVSNRAPHLTTAEIARFGEPFFRTLAAAERSADGNGLGVAVARKLLERGGATLGYSLADGVLTAELRLPQARD